MMNITVEIKAPELSNAILALANALGGNKVSADQVAATVEKAVKKEADKQQQGSTKDDTPTVTPTVTPEVIPPKNGPINPDNAVDVETEPEETGATDTPEEKPSYTLEQVREKLMDLSRNGKRAEVQEIITSYGVKKLTEIPAEFYAEVMAKVSDM